MRQLKISKSITARESRSVETYLRDIARIPLLNPDEEVELFEHVRRGSQAAKNKLVKANLRFVVSVAKRFQGQGLSLDDLINEGNFGLIRAIERFDQTRGFKFISFAVWWIRQSILQAIGEQARLVRVPLNKVMLGGQMTRVRAELEQQLERMPSEEEVAEAMKLESTDVMRGLELQARHVSFDAPTSEEEDATLHDIFADPFGEATDRGVWYTESLKTELDRTFAVLTERQREVLLCYFGIGREAPMNLDEIARQYDLTPERVRQIRDKALTKLRTEENYKLLAGFLRA
ncbi:MAG TPA: RNA polymerase sigma factor RpoD/SigA [Chitinophagaceae bacterium]|nr:RNA polymerase sigma factor RpoD/SigA [Chitinophagaceae bacterium]